MDITHLKKLQHRHSTFLNKCKDLPALCNSDKNLSEEVIEDYIKTIKELQDELRVLSPHLISRTQYSIMLKLRIEYLKNLNNVTK